jgi:hypothetical protein
MSRDEDTDSVEQCFRDFGLGRRRLSTAGYQTSLHERYVESPNPGRYLRSHEETRSTLEARVVSAPLFAAILLGFV